MDIFAPESNGVDSSSTVNGKLSTGNNLPTTEQDSHLSSFFFLHFDFDLILLRVSMLFRPGRVPTYIKYTSDNRDVYSGSGSGGDDSMNRYRCSPKTI